MSIHHQLIPKDGTSVAEFKPQKAKADIVKASAVIDAAKEIEDWPTLLVAVDRLMELQATVDEWWRKHVSPNRGGDRKSKNQVPRSAELMSLEDAEKKLQFTNQQISKWRKRLKDPVKYREMLYGAAYLKGMASENTSSVVTKWTGDAENYTPAKYIEAARQTMGGIDLDPATCAIAQKTVKATEWFDEEADGLAQKWSGRVFLNPPYSNPAVSHFIGKLLEEFTTGEVSAGVLLTNNSTDTKWWHLAASTSSAVCFTAGRISFYDADGKEAKANTNGQTFFYFGDDVPAFVQAFSEHGLIMAVVRA